MNTENEKLRTMEERNLNTENEIKNFRDTLNNV